MKKINKIISLILLIVGLLIILVGIIIATFNHKDSDINNNPSGSVNQNDNNQGDKNDEEKFDDSEELDLIADYYIEDFKVKNEDNIIRFSFHLTNESEAKKDGKKLNLNFYQNNEKLHTFQSEIKKLNSGDQILVEAFVNFEYDKITKYEFEIDGVKKVLEPTYVS